MTDCKPDLVMDYAATVSRHGGNYTGMSLVRRADIVRRLRLLQAELGLKAAGMAELAGTSRTNWYNWIAEDPQVPQMPSVEGLAQLAANIPGMTLDYLYLGKLDTLRGDVMIRMMAREQGLDPAAADFDQARVVAAALSAKAD